MTNPQGSELQYDHKILVPPLRKLMDDYCSRPGLQAAQVRLAVDGRHVTPDDTAGP